MRNRIILYDTESADNQLTRSLHVLRKTPVESSRKNYISEILSAEGSENFLNYIEWLGLDNDPDAVVLSSLHHFYYDAEEMKGVRTVINLRELNYVKEIKNFINSIFKTLSAKSYFVGCFIDNKKKNGYEPDTGSSLKNLRKRSLAIENGIISSIPFINRIYSLMDSRTNNYLSKENVNALFEEHGFKVLDMTDLNDMTYFCVQKAGTASHETEPHVLIADCGLGISD